MVNIRTAGAASKCSVANAIRILIRPNSLKPPFGSPLIVTLRKLSIISGAGPGFTLHVRRTAHKKQAL